MRFDGAESDEDNSTMFDEPEVETVSDIWKH